MANKERWQSVIALATILLLFNLSFSLFSNGFVKQRSTESPIGLSGPVVSFGQTIEATLVVPIKRSTKFTRLRLVLKRRHHRKNYALWYFSAIVLFLPGTDILKKTQNLKLEGG